MSSGKKDFYAKEVAGAIKKACASFKVPQEDLDIEVVETGSTGIFGLIRKKAHIRVTVKSGDLKKAAPSKPVKKASEQETPPVQDKKEKVEKAEPQDKKEKVEKAEPQEKKEKQDKEVVPAKEPEPLSPESVEIVRHDLSELLRLMGFPSEVTAEVDGATVNCQVSDEYEEEITGQEGKIIDSLQYLIRKMAARKVEQKIRFSIDIGKFREKRKVELMERAKELAALVREDGKTQVIPPLNPSERRVVHVVLQDEKDIRSRSVGSGLFKKVLIYKPGKGKKTGSGKRGGKGRAKQKAQENGDS